MGLGIGGVFVGIGAVELVLLGLSGALSGNLFIAAFLVVLGGSIIWLTYRGGLRDPIARIQLAHDAATFMSLSGRTVRVAWRDPAWDLEIQDPAPDPSVKDEAKQHLFFSGMRGVYGTLGRGDVGPMLDAARSYGLSVTIRNATSDRKREHPIRRIRIRASP